MLSFSLPSSLFFIVFSIFFFIVKYWLPKRSWVVTVADVRRTLFLYVCSSTLPTCLSCPRRHSFFISFLTLIINSNTHGRRRRLSPLVSKPQNRCEDETEEETNAVWRHTELGSNSLVSFSSSCLSSAIGQNAWLQNEIFSTHHIVWPYRPFD